MAVACDSTSLVANATCYQCQIPDGYKLPVLIALAVKIAGVNPDANYLVSQAACLECQIPPGMELPVLISLACAIANASGSNCVDVSGITYNGSPIPTATVNVVPGTIYTIVPGGNENGLTLVNGAQNITLITGTPAVITTQGTTILFEYPNLIPSSANFGKFLEYDFSAVVVPLQNYVVVWGTNESGIDIGNVLTPNPGVGQSTAFVAALLFGNTLDGNGSYLPVTARVYSAASGLSLTATVCPN